MIFDQSTKKNKQIIICDVVLHDVFRKYLLAKSCRQQKKRYKYRNRRSTSKQILLSVKFILR